MYNLRSEVIKSSFNSLKIDNNPFNMATAIDAIDGIPDDKLQEFYKSLFGTNHAFLNGMDRLVKVAEEVTPKRIDTNRTKAKWLINHVEAINKAVSDKAIATGEDFEKLVKNGVRVTLPEDDVAILDLVKPYVNHKELIIKIHHYQTGEDAIRAFEEAIKLFDKIKGTEAISANVLKKIKG